MELLNSFIIVMSYEGIRKWIVVVGATMTTSGCVMSSVDGVLCGFQQRTLLPGSPSGSLAVVVASLLQCIVFGTRVATDTLPAGPRCYGTWMGEGGRGAHDLSVGPENAGIPVLR